MYQRDISFDHRPDPDTLTNKVYTLHRGVYDACLETSVALGVYLSPVAGSPRLKLYGLRRDDVNAAARVLVAKMKTRKWLLLERPHAYITTETPKRTHPELLDGPDFKGHTGIKRPKPTHTHPVT